MTTFQAEPGQSFSDRADAAFAASGLRADSPRPDPDADAGIVDFLESMGASGEAYTVTLYRGQNQLGEFLTTYDGQDFGLPRVQADYGAGRYYAQVKRGTRLVRGVRFGIGAPPRVASAPVPAPAPVPVPAPAPAPAPGLDPLALIMGQMQRQHEMLMAMIRAQPAAPAVAADPLAGIDRVLKLVSPRNQIADVLETMRALRDLAPEAGGAGSEWAGLVQSLPALIASLPLNGGRSVESHPDVIKARRIIAAAQSRAHEPRPALATAPAMIPAPIETAEPRAAVVSGADSRAVWVRQALPLVRMAASLPDIDAGAYAQVVIDAIEAQGANVGDIIGPTRGDLVSVVIAEAPDLEQYAETLLAIEDAIREADQPGDEADPMQGQIDDNGRPRAGDPRQFPKSPAA